MKNFIFTLLFIFSISLVGQNYIPNGNFESWTTIQFVDVDDFETPVKGSQVILGSPTTIQSIDRISGNYSLRLETKTNGTDTIFGYITTGEFGQSNGFPFSQSPDSIVGYYKCDVMVGDTAIIVLNFSSAGTQFSSETYKFVGSQNTWTKFSFPISLSQTPDSSFLAVASSNAVDYVGVQPGSWLMVDSIAFAGAGITQTFPNFDFENWTTDTIVSLNDWAPSDAVSQTTDNQEGNYALKLETKADGTDTSFLAYNGQVSNGGLSGGQPFSISSDTLIGFYKYIPVGSDTAAMSLNFVKNGVLINSVFKVFAPQVTYSTFELPFNIAQSPDSMFVVLASSAFNHKIVGSAMYIDDLRLKSIITSLDKHIEELGEMNVYPNPTEGQLNLTFRPLKQKMNIQIIDALGRLYNEAIVGVGESRLELNLESLKSGIYYVRINIGDQLIHRQFIKK